LLKIYTELPKILAFKVCLDLCYRVVPFAPYTMLKREGKLRQCLFAAYGAPSWLVTTDDKTSMT